MQKKLIVISILLAGTILTIAAVPVSKSAARADDRSISKPHDQLLEVGHGSQLNSAPPSISSFRVLSYNIRWRGGEDLRKLIKLFRNDQEIGGAAILGLQEVDRHRKRSGNVNAAKLVADELGMYYAWAAPPAAPSASEPETGVAIMSAYPLSEVRRIVLPHAGSGKRRRVALGATVSLGQTKLRVYSVHSETRIAVKKKMQQLRAVLADLSQHPNMPAILMGDFNTWEPDAVSATQQLFKQAGFQTPFNEDSTFCRNLFLFDLELKLDWIWLRGLESTSHGIDRGVKISDHWPLWAVIRIVEKSSKPGKAVNAPTS